MSSPASAKDIFLAALEQPPEDRRSFVAAACGDDAGLRQEVESLLEFHEDEPAGEGEAEPGASFVPGAVFAARYRMVTRLGRGGMGDVWRADDLTLDTPVALKLIWSAGPAARAQILKEVRLARQITHQAICRVFDVGEADGAVFYSMELVQGENLATLVRRLGRLPSEKVTYIARQLCTGLAAAHAQGVLHRDLKPANVLIDDNGEVRITDFGIAITTGETTRQKMLVGTPAYMAPEQLMAGAPLSERTDVYALGIVLYELLTGQHPFAGAQSDDEPARPSSFVTGVDARLERAILRALSRDPRDRPASAAEMAALLPGDGSQSAEPSMRPWLVAAAVVGVVGTLAFSSSLFPARGPRGLTEQDTIVLADFQNTTGEPVFDGTLKVALAVGLEQSPFLRILPEPRVREALAFMERPRDEPVTRSIAREIAQREHLKVLLAGSIARLGRNYVLALEAINAENGDVMAREQVEVVDKEGVLTALGAATSRLREKLGESLPSIEKFNTPLPQATTASLEALHAYALALDQGRITTRPATIPHLKRAIEIDPNFAMAHALLSGMYANTGRWTLAPEHALKAYELRDRVSERERFFISWRYYHDATQDWDKALELARSWVTTYPREPIAFNTLGLALSALGQEEQAVDAFRDAIRLDARFVSPYANLGDSLMALNRFDEVKALLQEASTQRVDFISLRRIAYRMALLEHDTDGMARELKLALATPEAVWASTWEAVAAAHAGRLRGAHDQFRRAVKLALEGGFTEYGAQWTMQDAEAHAIVGQCSDTRREVIAGLELNRDNFTLERASRALALCGDADEVKALTDELSARFAHATLIAKVHQPVTAAALAIQRHNAKDALQLLDSVWTYDHVPVAELWPPYLRGQAYLQLKDGSAAGAQFQSILDHRGEHPASPLHPLARLGAARAAMLEGDVARARTHYAAFLDAWKDADSDLEVVKSARAEYERVRH